MKKNSINCRFVYHNDKFMDYHEAVLPVTNHSFNFGTAVFESIRIFSTDESSVVIGMNQHIERLNNSLKLMGLRTIEHEIIKEKIIEFIKINGMNEGYLRVIAYPDISCLKFDMTDAKVKLSIIGWNIESDFDIPPLALGVSSFRRGNPQSTLPYAKVCGLYVVDCVAHMNSKKQSFDDAIMLNDDGTVSEITGANIFIVVGGKILTPTIKNTIKGITREITFKICEKLSLECVEKDIIVDDLITADEVFITGTYHGIRRVSHVNGIQVGNGDKVSVVQNIIDGFKEIVDDKNHHIHINWMMDLKLNSSEKNLGGVSCENITVRRAREEDSEFVESCVKNLIMELTNKDESVHIRGIEKSYLDIINKSCGGIIFIAESEEKRVGVISGSIQSALRCGGEYLIIQELWVEREYRSLKIGNKLINKIEEYCRDRGINRIEVGLPSDKFKDCFRTQNFYSEKGFESIGLRKKKILT